MVMMRLGRLPLADSDRDLIYISGQPAYDIGTNPHEKTYPYMTSFDSAGDDRTVEASESPESRNQKFGGS